jgi:uncharacterized protein
MTVLPPTHGTPVPSPCNSVCLMNEATGFCRGCFRTLDEIAEWGLLDDDAKRGVWTALARRRDADSQSARSGDAARTDADVDR